MSNESDCVLDTPYVLFLPLDLVESAAWHEKHKAEMWPGWDGCAYRGLTPTFTWYPRRLLPEREREEWESGLYHIGFGLHSPYDPDANHSWI